MTPKYFGPCRAGLHPELGWGTPCLNDATWYVEIHGEPGPTYLVKLCSEHASQAGQFPGFRSGRLLGDGALTYERPAS